MPKSMVLKIGRDLYPVGSLAEASALYSEMRDDSGEGYSTWPEGQIVGTDLRVAYNGKIFKGKWVQGQKPVYDPYGPALEGGDDVVSRKMIAAWANKLAHFSGKRGAPELTEGSSKSELLNWCRWAKCDGDYNNSWTVDQIWSLLRHEKHCEDLELGVDDDNGPALEGGDDVVSRKMIADWANAIARDSRYGSSAPRLKESSSKGALLNWHRWNDKDGEWDGEWDEDDLWALLRQYYDDEHGAADDSDHKKSAPVPAGRSRSAPRRIIPWISTAEEQRAAAAGDEDTLNRWWQVKSAPRHDQAAWWRDEIEWLLAYLYGGEIYIDPLPREVHPLLPDISELVDPDVVEVAIKGPKHNRWSEYVEDGSISTLVEELLEQARNASDSQIMQYAEEFYEGTL